VVTAVVNASLCTFLAELRVSEPPQDSDGSYSLVFDSQYRVTFLALAHGDLLLESRIFQLPDEQHSRRATMQMLLEQAGSRLQSHSEWIAFAPGAQMLVLQQVVPAQADRAHFRALLDDFVNALAGWRRLAGVL
jgi:hypothetical protein